jgi:hypothetical protein
MTEIKKNIEKKTETNNIENNIILNLIEVEDNINEKKYLASMKILQKVYKEDKKRDFCHEVFEKLKFLYKNMEKVWYKEPSFEISMEGTTKFYGESPYKRIFQEYFSYYYVNNTDDLYEKEKLFLILKDQKNEENVEVFNNIFLLLGNYKIKFDISFEDILFLVQYINIKKISMSITTNLFNFLFKKNIIEESSIIGLVLLFDFGLLEKFHDLRDFINYDIVPERYKVNFIKYYIENHDQIKTDSFLNFSISKLVQKNIFSEKYFEYLQIIYSKKTDSYLEHDFSFIEQSFGLKKSDNYLIRYIYCSVCNQKLSTCYENKYKTKKSFNYCHNDNGLKDYEIYLKSLQLYNEKNYEGN